MRLFTLKLIIVSVVAGALMLAGSGAAFASTQTSEAGGIEVVASLSDTAAAGDSIDALFSVENKTAQWKYTLLCISLSKDDSGVYSLCKNVLLPPLRKFEFSYSFDLPYSVPGIYDVTISAGEASATASIELL